MFGVVLFRASNIALGQKTHNKVVRFHNKDKMHEFREAKENDYKGICSLVRNSDEMFFFYPKGNYPLTVDQLRRLSKDRKELTVVIDKNTSLLSDNCKRKNT